MASATVICIGATLASSTAAHPQRTGCAPQGAMIFAKSRAAEVYELTRQRVVGCIAGSGRHVQLGIGELCAPVPGRCPQGVVPGGARPATSCRSAADLRCGLLASVGLAGSVVAYDEFRNDRSLQEVHFMSVRNLRNGRMLHRFKLSTNEDVQQIVLTQTGATAWVEFNREPGCFSFGHDGNRCYGTFSIYAVGKSGFRALALSLIAEPTLSLAGPRLTWTAGGHGSTTTLA